MVGMGKIVVGLVEPIKIKGEKRTKRVAAKIDTGADRTSVDIKLASEVGLGPVTDTAKVRSATGNTSEIRPVVEAKIIIHDRSFTLNVSLDDRSKMKHEILIGRDLLARSDFLIDPNKTATTKKSS